MDFCKEVWTESDYKNYIEYIKSQTDEKYRKFHTSLVPIENSKYILGVRMPLLRKIGKEISKGNAYSFLKVSQTTYYEESTINGIVIGQIKTKSYDEFIALVEEYIPQISNWALCDSFSTGLKSVKKYFDKFFDYALSCLDSKNDWKVRFGFVSLMGNYLDEKHIDKILTKCDTINSDSYYVFMAQAWMLATAYAKCEEKTKAYFLSNNLNNQTLNKAIQKCIESRRIDDESKKFLRTLKKH